MEHGQLTSDLNWGAQAGSMKLPPQDASAPESSARDASEDEQ